MVQRVWALLVELQLYGILGGMDHADTESGIFVSSRRNDYGYVIALS